MQGVKASMDVLVIAAKPPSGSGIAYVFEFGRQEVISRLAMTSSCLGDMSLFFCLI